MNNSRKKTGNFESNFNLKNSISFSIHPYQGSKGQKWYTSFQLKIISVSNVIIMRGCWKVFILFFNIKFLDIRIFFSHFSDLCNPFFSMKTRFLSKFAYVDNRIVFQVRFQLLSMLILCEIINYLRENFEIFI